MAPGAAVEGKERARADIKKRDNAVGRGVAPAATNQGDEARAAIKKRDWRGRSRTGYGGGRCRGGAGGRGGRRYKE